MKRHISNYFWVSLFTLVLSIFTLWILVQMTGKEADVVCGYRAKRKDTASRRYASKIANWITGDKNASCERVRM